MLFGCVNNRNSRKDLQTNVEESKSYTKEFTEFGFSITSPCELKDVSSQSTGQFEVNYGGVTNQNDKDKLTAYQVMVTKLPIGYKNLDSKELKRIVDELILSQMQNFSNVKRTSFSDEGYSGYVGDTQSHGLNQRGVIFYKDGYIIALTVLTNYELVQKFNKFTNGFKTIKDNNKADVTRSQNRKKHSSPNLSRKQLALGVSVVTPCRMIKHDDDEYTWSGAINEEDLDGPIYRVAISPFTPPYNKMTDYERQSIRDRILNYVYSKRNYTKANLPIKSIFAYIMSFTEDGYISKDCMILTNEYAIELMLFSKRGIKDADFKTFINSIRIK